MSKLTLIDAYNLWAENLLAEKDSESDAGGLFRASSLGTCHRQQVLRRKGYKMEELTPGRVRLLYERNIMHEQIVAAWTSYGLGYLPGFRVDESLPEGWRGAIDILGHHRCECGQADLRSEIDQWCEKPDRPAAESWHALGLHEHTWSVVDAKTVDRNIVRYVEKLPKFHNALQVTAYARALTAMLECPVLPELVYLPVGGAEDPLWFNVENMDHALSAEYSALTLAWEQAQGPGFIYPDALPLMEQDSKDGAIRVVKLVQSWECGWCEFANTDLCTPATSQNKTGDRVGFLGAQGETIYVRPWLEKMGYLVPPGVVAVDKVPAH